jgi:hypothetical protein
MRVKIERGILLAIISLAIPLAIPVCAAQQNKPGAIRDISFTKSLPDGRRIIVYREAHVERRDQKKVPKKWAGTWHVERYSVLIRRSNGTVATRLGSFVIAVEESSLLRRLAWPVRLLDVSEDGRVLFVAGSDVEVVKCSPQAERTQLWAIRYVCSFESVVKGEIVDSNTYDLGLRPITAGTQAIRTIERWQVVPSSTKHPDKIEPCSIVPTGVDWESRRVWVKDQDATALENQKKPDANRE